MQFKSTYLALAVLAGFGLALGACSSSSDDDAPPTDMDGMEKPDPAIAQRTAIKSAIATASSTVAAVDDEATDAQVTAAENAIAAAKKAIADAANVPAYEKDANTGTVKALESQLTVAKTSRMAALDEMKKAGAKDAEALFNGFRDGTDLTVSVTSISDKHGGGMASVAATGLTPGVEASDVKKSAAPMLGMWQGTMLTDANADNAATDPGTSSTVVVYTDINAPEAVPFEDVYTLDANGNLANSAVVLPANRPKVKASAFVHTGRKNHDPDPDAGDDVVMIRGTFNGASGEYRCVASTATACASYDAGKGVVRLVGTTWIFDPDSGAMAMMADPSYAYFGWWLNKGTTEGVEAGVFHGVTDLTGDDAKLAAPTDINPLGGMATYNGQAAGKYAINPSLSYASGGHWTAEATLTAEWGAEDAPGMISGMINGFKAGGQDMDWKVNLGKTVLTSTGTFNSSTGDPATGDGVVWTIGGVAGNEAGSWQGGLRGTGKNGVPPVATGMFTATHGTPGNDDEVGHMVGAFGAHVAE